jgi:H+-transporting ATPase
MFVFLFLKYYAGLPWAVIQTVFFLKLTVSGHLLIYVAHTKKTWFKFLPSKQVIFATTITQIIATLLAFTGLFMPARLTLPLIIFVWAWTIFWMQINELAKHFTLKETS